MELEEDEEKKKKREHTRAHIAHLIALEKEIDAIQRLIEMELPPKIFFLSLTPTFINSLFLTIATSVGVPLVKLIVDVW